MAAQRSTDCTDQGVNGEVWSVKRAAKWLGVSDETVLNMIHSGVLPASNLNTKPGAKRPRWKIHSEDARGLLKKTLHQPAKPTRRKKVKAAAKDYFSEEAAQ